MEERAPRDHARPLATRDRRRGRHPETDTDTAADLLFGALIYRLLNGNTPLTERRATALAQAALDGLLRPR